jgi:hypothetical protein
MALEQDICLYDTHAVSVCFLSLNAEKAERCINLVFQC